jgi:hypothetical protein
MSASALVVQLLLPEQAEHRVLINATVASMICSLILFDSLGYVKKLRR